MSNKVFINQHDLVEIIVDGDQTVTSVTKMSDDAQNLLVQKREDGEPALLLDNLKLIGKVPPEALKVVVARVKAMPCDKFAIVGNDKLLRPAINLVLQAINRSNKVKYFSNYDDAVAWLKSSTNQ